MSEAEVEDGEETVDIEEQIKPFLFETEKELMSYSDAFEARVRDRFMVFLQEIKDAGASEENLHIMKNARFIIKGKQRRASDLVTVQCTAENIFVRAVDEEVRVAVLKYLKNEKGFKKVKEQKEEQLVVVSLPKMDIERKFELSDFLEQKYKQFHKNIMGVKSQTNQQLKAGMEREYIDGPDASTANKEIEEIIVHYVKLGKLIFWARQKDVLRHQFKLTSEDDIMLARQIGSVKHLVL
jgi:ribosome recycling factor